MVTTTTLGGQRVLICTCTRMGCHLATFTRRPGSSLYTLATEPPRVAACAQRRIGLVMEVAHTSMIRAAAPHFLWPFAVRYTVHQLNLWPRVSLPETSPTLRWTGKVGDASVFRVWGSRAFVHDKSAEKLSPCAIPCVFLGFIPDAPRWQFYHPNSRRVLPSQDVTFDKSVPFYRLFPYRSAPPQPPPLFLAPGPPPVDPLPPQGPAPSGVSQVDPLPGPAPVQPGGAESEGAETRGAEPGGVATRGGEPGGTKPESVGPGGAGSEGAESEGAECQGAALSGDSAGASPRLSLQQLREWFSRRVSLRIVEGIGAGGNGVGGHGFGGAGAGGAGAVDPSGSLRPCLYFVSLLQQVLSTPSSTGLTPPLLCPPPDQSQPPLQTTSPLPAPSPYTEQSDGLTERREPASRPVLPVRTAPRVPRSRPPPVPGTHAMTLPPSSVPPRVPLPAPPESSLPEVPDPESDRARAASPIVSRLLATTVTDNSFESVAASALVAELLEFAAACCIDYAIALVAESASASPPSVGVECALGTDFLEDRQEDFECLAAAVPCLASMLLAPEGDPDEPHIPTPRFYAEAITAFLQGSLHEEIWLRRPHGFTGSFPARTQWSLRRPVHGLRQAPHEWHDTLRTTLAALGFALATADPSLFLHTDTSLPPFYILVYVDDLVLATADTEALTLKKSELQKRHTCTDLGELRSYLCLQITRDRARRTITLTQSHMVHQVL
ncbi:unnamed protein product [Closterium sp. NIES-54]